MPRLFVGIFLPDTVKSDIEDFQKTLTNLPMKMKPVPSKDLHLSLSFLGNVPHEQVPEYEKGLKEACSRHKRFTVKVSGGVVIPNENHIRVITLGASSNNGSLENLRKDVVKAVGGDSHPGHLTVGRVREISDKKMVTDVVKKCDLEKYFEVDTVVLVKSTLKSYGPRYDVISEFSLA